MKEWRRRRSSNSAAVVCFQIINSKELSRLVYLIHSSGAEGGEAKGRRIRMSLISEMDVIMVTITKIIFIKLIERILRFEDVA